MKRISTKVGDVFVVLHKDRKKYFQYIANDSTQLNSDVVRSFKRQYPIDAEPELSEVIDDDIDFHAHCVTTLGLKMKVWEKVGNLKELGDVSSIVFRSAADYARKAGEEPIKVSNKWYVWRIDDKNFTHIGELTSEYQQASLGIVVNPYDLVSRIWTGKYLFDYPDFKH